MPPAPSSSTNHDVQQNASGTGGGMILNNSDPLCSVTQQKIDHKSNICLVGGIHERLKVKNQ